MRVTVVSRLVGLLKALAARGSHSPLAESRAQRNVRTARSTVMKEIERDWAQQPRRPSATEIDRWIEVGRAMVPRS